MKTEYELIEYTDENPIQVGDEVNVGGMWMRVVSIDHNQGQVFLEKPPCPDTGESLWITSVKQGRRPVKKEIVSGVKVATFYYDQPYRCLIDGRIRSLRDFLESGKTYILIEKEDGE